MGDTFLTPKQLRVLELRGRGYTQEEIAELLGTSRVNVCITEKRAKENIQKARNTLEAFERLDPVILEIPPGIDVFQVPRLIFREADKHGIKVLYNTTSLIGILRRKAEAKLRGNQVIEGIRVLILRQGKVIFQG